MKEQCMRVQTEVIKSKPKLPISSQTIRMMWLSVGKTCKV